MESFTAQFAKLKEEFLALFRTREAMAAVGEMVENIVDLFQDLKPQLVDAFVSATEAFARLVSEGGLRSLFEMLFDILTNVVPVLTKLVEILGAGEAKLIKFAVAMKMASFFFGRYNGLLMDGKELGELWSLGTERQRLNLEKLHIQLQINEEQQLKNLLTDREAITMEERLALRIEQVNLQLQNQNIEMELASQKANHAILVYQKYFNVLNFGTNILMSAVSASMMLAMSTDGVSRNMAYLLTIVQALNVAMAVYTALGASKNAGYAALAVMAVYLTGIALLTEEFRQQEKKRQTQVADTGMFVSGTRRNVYDEGGMVGPRHKLVYVEPGEQIISKTQGMVGMGGANVTVNIGEIYAEDGTDFADKLAEALPNALRRTSYSGGF